MRENGRKTERTMRFKFRWPVVMTAEDHTVEMIIPLGNNGASILDHRFVEHFNLNDNELERAENSVIRAIALVPES